MLRQGMADGVFTTADLEALKSEIQAAIKRKASLSGDGQSASERSLDELRSTYDWMLRQIQAQGDQVPRSLAEFTRR